MTFLQEQLFRFPSTATSRFKQTNYLVNMVYKLQAASAVCVTAGFRSMSTFQNFDFARGKNALD